MDDIYRYPVFFECLSLSEEQRRKIERYFLIHRKSSGGECGEVRREKEHTFSVAFRYERDQQAVLKRYEHVVNDMVFTVRSSLEPHACSPSQDLTAPAQQRPQSIAASTPPPSGEEYELGLDPYLLRYLKECSRAGEELQEELASVACSAQLYPEEGRLLVSRLAQPGAARDGGNWKAEVDRIFDGYLCHYEVEDPRKVKALLQSCGSRQTTGEVKVYSEVGVAVVVGRRSQVNARLMDLEDRPGLSESFLQGISPGNSAPSDVGSQRGATAGAPEDAVHVEVVQGTIETMEVDVVASPMLGVDPLSTRVGHTLFATLGPRLTAKFRQEAGDNTLPGDAVLVELPSKAVFFLSLIPWDDPEGTAVQVLSLAINNLLTSCEKRGFGSVALPVLGAGIALGFPNSVVAKVLLDQVHVFEQNRASRMPLLVRIVIHPSDEEAREAFKSVQDNFRLTRNVPQPDQASATRRIVLLGNTGSGKSNLANTIFGEEVFTVNHSPSSGTSECRAVTRSVKGRSITLIDTPGFFDTAIPEEKLRPEIVRCITECSPGPHAFLIVLEVKRFTQHEQDVIAKIRQYFTKDAMKYAVIVFTHGEQLPRGMKIEEFVRQNKKLSDLVKECGGRCHVVDNKYWQNDQQDECRSNNFQVEALLNTVDRMVTHHDGGFYSNAVFQEIENVIQIEEVRIRQNMSSGDMQPDEIRRQARRTAHQVFLNHVVGTATGALLGAVFGVAVSVGLVLSALRNCVEFIKLVKTVGASGGVAAAGAAGGVEVAGLVVGATTVLAVTGGAIGGVTGCEAAKEAETLLEAAQMAASAVMTKGKAALKQL